MVATSDRPDGIPWVLLESAGPAPRCERSLAHTVPGLSREHGDAFMACYNGKRSLPEE
jgi:hypothetical protein